MEFSNGMKREQKGKEIEFKREVEMSLEIIDSEENTGVNINSIMSLLFYASISLVVVWCRGYGAICALLLLLLGCAVNV